MRECRWVQVAGCGGRDGRAARADVGECAGRALWEVQLCAPLAPSLLAEHYEAAAAGACQHQKQGLPSHQAYPVPTKADYQRQATGPDYRKDRRHTPRPVQSRPSSGPAYRGGHPDGAGCQLQNVLPHHSTSKHSNMRQRKVRFQVRQGRPSRNSSRRRFRATNLPQFPANPCQAGHPQSPAHPTNQPTNARAHEVLSTRPHHEATLSNNKKQQQQKQLNKNTCPQLTRSMPAVGLQANTLKAQRQ